MSRERSVWKECLKEKSKVCVEKMEVILLEVYERKRKEKKWWRDLRS